MQRARKANELLNWINDFLGFEYSQISELSDGVALLQVFHALYPDSGSLARVNIQAESRHHFEHNYKILQQMFQKIGIDKEFTLANVLEKKKQELYHLVAWAHRHFTDQLKSRGVTTIEYNAVDERSKALEAKRSLRKKGRCDTFSETGSLASSGISGRSSSTNYTSSYNRNRAARFAMNGLLPTRRKGDSLPPTPHAAVASCVAIAAISALRRPPVLLVFPAPVPVEHAGVSPAAVAAKPQPTLDHCGDVSPKQKHPPSFRMRRKMQSKAAPQGRLQATKRQAINTSDYVPAKSLIPFGFDFLDPTTWSGESVCRRLAVAEWNFQNSAFLGHSDPLDKLINPPSVSPSVFYGAPLSTPHTPATVNQQTSQPSSLFPGGFPLSGNDSSNPMSEDELAESFPSDPAAVGS